MPTTTGRTPARAYGGLSAGERVAARRERLLDAALELYGTRGFLATGVKDVCRAAGLTDRYFYESFTNSGDLFGATFDRTATQLLSVVAAAVKLTPETLALAIETEALGGVKVYPVRLGTTV